MSYLVVVSVYPFKSFEKHILWKDFVTENQTRAHMCGWIVFLSLLSSPNNRYTTVCSFFIFFLNALMVLWVLRKKIDVFVSYLTMVICMFSGLSCLKRTSIYFVELHALRTNAIYLPIYSCALNKERKTDEPIVCPIEISLKIYGFLVSSKLILLEYIFLSNCVASLLAREKMMF